MKDLTASLLEHYSRRLSYQTVLGNLERKKIDLKQVRPENLYPYDQFHVGGISATRMLAERAGLQPHSCVVDVGCGVGGAARYLHAAFSCQVIGIEIGPAMLETALQLNRLIGGVARVHFIAAQADALPVPARFADVVWTQHLTMNLPDPCGFLRQCARVLKPSGRLALHEWFLNRPGTLSFPLPWAPKASLNHAVASDEFLQLLRAQGFVPEAEDVTTAMRDSLRADIRALAYRDASRDRLTALENLLQAANDGLLRCLMITATKTPPG